MKGDFLTTAFNRIRSRMRYTNASDDDSDDALQDAFCRLWGRREEIVGEKQAEGLLSVAARNIKIDGIRRRNTHPSVSLDDFDVAEYAGEDESGVAETYRRVDRIVSESLSGRDREILLHRDRDGWDFDELAQYYGLSEANVRLIVSRSRKSIRNIYREQNKKNL